MENLTALTDTQLADLAEHLNVWGQTNADFDLFDAAVAEIKSRDGWQKGFFNAYYLFES